MQYFSVEHQPNGIAVVWLDQQDSPVNKIAPAMIDECALLVTQLETDNKVQGIVLISRKKDFIAGADLDAIYKVSQLGEWLPTAKRGHALLHHLEQSPKPIVAAIHGAAMGGGLEVALACQYRLASDHPSTVFALPEVQLGLLPGGGGTQRLPALIGAKNALDMMLTGKKIYSYKALKMGLVDRLVSEHTLLRAAIQQALDMVGKEIVRKDNRSIPDKLLENNPIGRGVLFDKARQQVNETTQGNYPAPFKIIECVEVGLRYGKAAGYDAELKKFDELTASPISKRLIDLFFGMTNKKRNPQADLVQPINHIAILGAGFMGKGIAEVNIAQGMPTTLKDISQEMLSKTRAELWQAAQRKVKSKALTSFAAEQTFNLMHTQLDYAHFDKTDLVIEAVFENLSLKQTLLAETEAHTHDRCIFATNTSALPIAAIAEHSTRPHLVVGMHYFSPVPKMPLLEIVRTPKTADWVTATVVEIGIKQGKTCIVVNDGPGFYTTRILAPLLNEALLLLEEGADIADIDQAAREAGFPVGPITLMDEVGIDVGAHIMSGDLVRFFQLRGGDAFKMSQLIAQLHQAGYAGRKNGRGFYRYDKQGQKIKGALGVNSEIYTLFLGGEERSKIKLKEIRHRLVMMMCNEAARCLEEGIIMTPTDGDLGAVLGLGFPPFTGGPFRYLDALGCDKAISRLSGLAEKYGARFAPADIINEYAHNGKRFY
jgi:3-hydroxyacyl-CoA dehydrogenase/enoyl-CoA hydratase/3-hydroxybutyryl-CoA epimerase